MIQIHTKKTDRIYERDAYRTIGDVDGMTQIVDQQPKNLTKTQSDDGQVIAPQARVGAPIKIPTPHVGVD